MMEQERQLVILERLAKVFEKNVVAAECDTGSRSVGRDALLAHCKAMLPRIEGFVMDRRHAKADRWIGFVQGALVAHGVRSIDEFRAMNDVDLT